MVPLLSWAMEEMRMPAGAALTVYRSTRCPSYLFSPCSVSIQMYPSRSSNRQVTAISLRPSAVVMCWELSSLPGVPARGTVWIYLAMDAHSRFAFHHVIKAQSILPEYVMFIMEVLKKHPELNKAKLAVDSQSDTISMLKKVFPDLSDVICEKAKVNEVTEEFHVAFLAHMGLAGRSN